MAASHIRMVLLGKTGAGKSSLANTILGESVFGTHHTADSGTSVCQTETNEVHGRTITVTDTPGFFDSKKSEEEMKPEILKCITDCSPGPHAFLIVLKVERFTDQENEVITKIQESFSEEAFKHAVVVFTHGEQLQEGMKIEEFVGENEKLRDLLQKCGGRCHVVDNKYWKNNQEDEYRNNQVQVSALLNTIDGMIEANGGGCYTNEMLQEVERRIQEEEERIRQTAGDMTEKQIREQAKSNVGDVLKKIAGVTTGVLLGALLGAVAVVAVVVSTLMAVTMATGVGGAAAAAPGALKVAVIGGGIAAVAGAVIGGCIGYEEAEQADSVGEAVNNAAEALGRRAVQPFKQIAKSIKE